MKTIIYTKNAPEPIGPYSQAVRTGNLLFISAQIPTDPATGEVVGGGIEAETEMVMKNLEAILKAAGASFEHVVKTTIFLKDMGNFAAVNQIYGSYFTADFPARETVQAAALPKNVNVEISVIADLG